MQLELFSSRRPTVCFQCVVADHPGSCARVHLPAGSRCWRSGVGQAGARSVVQMAAVDRLDGDGESSQQHDMRCGRAACLDASRRHCACCCCYCCRRRGNCDLIATLLLSYSINLSARNLAAVSRIRNVNDAMCNDLLTYERRAHKAVFE